MFNRSSTYLFLIRSLKKLFFFLSLFGLSACSIFEPIKTQSINYFTLTATPPPLYCKYKKQHTKKTILVTYPLSNVIYNSTGMIYIPTCYQIQHFSRNRWADSPSHLLLPLLIKSLQNTGYFQAIINTPTTVHYDWILNTQLISFQQEFLRKPSQFRITLRAQLINAKTNRITATRDFTVVKTSAYDNPYGGAFAANQATREILSKINKFCLVWAYPKKHEERKYCRKQN